MDFSLGDDARAVVDLAAGLFADHGTDDRIRALHESGDPFDADLWAQLGGTGLLALALPEGDGGSGLGMLELALVAEASGRFLAPVPYWQGALAALAVARFGGERPRADHLRALAAGRTTAAVWTEAGADPSVAARRAGEGWALSGPAATVAMDARTDLLLLPVATAEGPRLALVPARAAGLGRTEGVATHGLPVADLRFDDVALPGDAVIGGPDAAAWLEERSLLLLAALQLGVVGEALRRASAFVGERQQFGRPIGSFQAVAVRMAGAYTEVELLRGAVWQLAWRLDAGLPAAAAARVAKFQAASAGHLVGHTAQHYHGGIGADLTYPAHRYFLWARALEMTGGGAEAQLARLGAAPLPRFEGG